MMPNMNSRQMKQAMKRMGIQQQEVQATEVIIRTPDSEIVIVDPSVQKVNMMGQWSYQISGEEHERSLDTAAEINDEDVQTVMEQANVSEQEARDAIAEADGDLAQAILNLANE